MPVGVLLLALLALVVASRRRGGRPQPRSVGADIGSPSAGAVVDLTVVTVDLAIEPTGEASTPDGQPSTPRTHRDDRQQRRHRHLA